MYKIPHVSLLLSRAVFKKIEKTGGGGSRILILKCSHFFKLIRLLKNLYGMLIMSMGCFGENVIKFGQVLKVRHKFEKLRNRQNSRKNPQYANFKYVFSTYLDNV